MNLSFSTRGWPKLTWDEMLTTALDMGFAGIEVYNLPKFEDMLSKFKKESDEKMSFLKTGIKEQRRNRG